MSIKRDWVALARIHDTLHPEIYVKLHEVALRAKTKQMHKVSIELLINLVRWEYGVGICQNYARGYKIMLEERDPVLIGFFNYRANLHTKDIAEAEGQLA